MQDNEIKKQTKDEGLDYYKLLIGLVGVYSILEELLVIMKNSLKFATRNKMPLKIFFQAIVSGFEQKMSKIMLKERVDPGQTTSSFPLKDLHHKVASSILDIKHHRHRISETFKKSFHAHLKGMNKPVDKTITALFEGTKQIPDLYEIDKIELINKILFVPYIDFSRYYKISISAISASVATLLINIDALGRFVGKQLAVISRYSLSNAIAEKTITSLKIALVATYIHIDLTKRLKKYTLKFITKGIYFPIFSGIFVGMYSNLDKDKPELTKQLKAVLAETIPVKDKSIFLLIKESFIKAQNKHQDLGTTLLNKQSSSEELITHNFYTSKQLIEALRIITSLLKKSSFAKTCFIAFKAFPKIVRKATALLTFKISKTSTSTLYALIKSINKNFTKANQQRSTDKTMEI